MPDFFRDQPVLRFVIGTCIVVAAWILYLTRVIFGIGPSRDYEGNQAPALHYLVGAIVVTGMVAAWIAARTVMTPKRRDRQ